jgi:hypothetical protein
MARGADRDFYPLILNKSLEFFGNNLLPTLGCCELVERWTCCSRVKPIRKGRSKGRPSCYSFLTVSCFPRGLCHHAELFDSSSDSTSLVLNHQML